MDSKQNGEWYAATRCDATKSDITFESCATMKQWVLILCLIGKFARSDRLATRSNASYFDLNLSIRHTVKVEITSLMSANFHIV